MLSLNSLLRLPYPNPSPPNSSSSSSRRCVSACPIPVGFSVRCISRYVLFSPNVHRLFNLLCERNLGVYVSWQFCAVNCVEMNIGDASNEMRLVTSMRWLLFLFFFFTLIHHFHGRKNMWKPSLFLNCLYPNVIETLEMFRFHLKLEL